MSLTVRPLLRLSLAAVIATSLVAAALAPTPAYAAQSRISIEEQSAMRAAMTRAGVSEAEQDSLIALRQSGKPSESERKDTAPIAVDESPLAGGGTIRIETFADGSQRTVSRVPSGGAATDGRLSTFTTIECNLVHCTILLSRAQTKQMATSMAAAGAIIAALCGPAAWACAIGVGIMVDTANRAVSQGKCAGIRRFVTTAPAWPIIEPCRQ